jgi:hypothetical protein
MRTRQSLSDLIAGRLSSPDGRSELMKLATRLIVEEALEGENRDAVGRDYYEHGAEPGRGLAQRRVLHQAFRGLQPPRAHSAADRRP